MKRFKISRPTIRAITIFGAMAAIVTGVTFAALQSQDATLQGNNITSASANLTIGDSVADLSDSMPGFLFDNVVPGGDPSPADDHAFYLANSGTTKLELKAAIAPGMNWPSNVDISQVSLRLTDPDGQIENAPLDILYNSYNTGFTDLGWTLDSGASRQYKLQVVIRGSALDGGTTSSFSITNMNLVFSGTALDVS